MNSEIYERVYVWEMPLRLSHWVTVAAFLTLCVTGFYIGRPIFGGSVSLMAWMRGTHRIAAWALVASLAARIYWAFIGNRWASWQNFFPYFWRERWHEMAETFLYYIFLRRRPPGVTGHNPLAGIAYSAVYFLLFIQVITGFALQSVGSHGWREVAFGWVFSLLSLPYVRLVHRLDMWLLLGFAIHHLYSATLMDIEERNGLMTSIFSGYKFREKREAS
ncbi:MAG TPA: Ni/Fe-hydrogenase, b-type cytochrome subunit [Candidatus Binatia bacterium]|jgi:Ni/Fe-hydrogenase 1 B-type cytochrome subunit